MPVTLLDRILTSFLLDRFNFIVFSDLVYQQ